MAALLQEWAKQLKNSLTRNSLVSASRWAEQYRFMDGDFAGPWNFKHHSWLQGIHDSEAPYNVAQKAAQMGFSEAMLNIAFFQMDMKHRDVLYILPNTRPDAADFSASRFDKAISLSPHLKLMFNDTNNVGHKKSGSRNLYVRGANSRSGLKSLPASVLIFDEFDEMDENKISLAEERASGQLNTIDWKISTPTIPDYGINKLYEASTQETYQFRCPSCSKFIDLKFPDNLVITGDHENDPKILNSHLICLECRNPLVHELKHTFIPNGHWVPNNQGSLTRGFHINQLYSSTLHPYKFAKLYCRSLTDQFAEQELYNSKMGMAHIIQGSRISDSMFDELIKDYSMQTGCRSQFVTTMGVDVGRVLHVHIDGWDLSDVDYIDINSKARCQTLWVGEVQDFHQLDALMRNYSIKFCVVDAQPETRKATEFAYRFNGLVRICRYNHNIAARQLVTTKDSQENDLYVQVARTPWLDQALGRYKNKTISLPNNLPSDYRDHIKAPVRCPQKDTDGNPIYKYITPGSRADHYAHARVYSEIALPFALTGSFQDIGTVL